MADFNFAQPVRSVDDNTDAGDLLVTQINGGTTPANKAEVNGTNELLVKDTDVETAVTAVDDTLNNGTGLIKVWDGTDTVAVNDDGSINVNVVDTQVGDQIHVYGTAVGGVPNTATDTATYTVTVAKILLLKAAQGAASGKAKIELLVGGVAKATAFVGTGSSAFEFIFPSPIEVAAGVIVKVQITNKDNANQDLYGFINGIEVDA
jgi:hypothetical protein